MKRDLNETWELCMKMWKWIVKVYDSSVSVNTLKARWMQKHGFEGIECNCFFCDWREEIVEEFEELQDILNPCKILCPAKIASNEFTGCCSKKYHYEINPKAFYQEIKRIYEIRESMKK